MLSTRNPEAAAEEIEKWGPEESYVGAMILNGPSEKPLGHPRYDVIYRAAEDNDMPIVFHSSAVGYSLGRKFPFMYQDLERYASLHALSHPMANMVTLTSLAMNGTFEKFGDLDFVFLEQDLGIVPLMLPRLNREAAQHPYEVPLLEKTPEEYIRDQCYFATQPVPEPNDINDARRVIDIVGPDRIMYASDHPHGDFDPPGAIVDKYFGHLDEDDLKKILHENAMDVFDISA
jgi:predicted TIM-barrel fold metal-dependent hydrolase